MPATPDPATTLQTLAILAELTVKGAVVLGLAALLTFMIRRAPAADRHAVWFVAMAGIVLLPAAAALLPDWRAVETPAWMQLEQSKAVASGGVSSDGASPPVAGFHPSNPAGTASVNGSVVHESSPDATTTPGSGSNESAAADRAGTNPVVNWLSQIVSGVGSLHWSVLLFWIWIAGAGLILLNLILGAMQLLRISGRSRPVQGNEWRDLADEVGDRLFVTREVLILKGSSTRMPMTWGGLRPVVLLPSDADTWSTDKKRCVLTHEFAHIKRWDTTTQGIAQIACAVFWFNPLVWVAAARLRTEREKACDETVIALGTQPSDYADHMLDLAQTVEQSALHPLGAVAMAKPTQLEGRVLSILRNRPHGFRTGRTARIVGLVAAVLLFFPLAALSPSAPGAETTAQGFAESMRKATGERSPDTELDVDPAVAPDVAPDVVSPSAEAMTTPVPLQEAPADTIDVPRERLTAVFIEALSDSDPDIRRNAAHMLGDLDVEDAIEALGQTLRSDSDDDVRRSAAWALGEIGGAAGAEYLVDGLDDSVPAIRRAVIHALEDLDHIAAVPAIRSRISSETNPDVRSAMVWMLGEFEDPASLDVLIDALDDADEEVRSMAVWALGELEDERAVDALTELMQDENVDVRHRVMWALQEIESPRSLDTFIAATRDQDPEIRRHAVLGLNELEDPRSVERLIELLDDENEEVRTMAAHTLGEIEDDRAAAPLAELLSDQSSKVRRAAIHALSEFETDASRDALIGAVKANDPEVRLAAVTALHEFEDAETVRALETVLTEDSDAEIRKRAARMLMHMETDDALDALDRALEAGGDVREAVMQALGQQ